ncbi:Sodium/hydrogen exchanger family-domain-containing protein [Catenaria anguillulae PL171]|uniref:Sodium/hydrogen exchanger family-domain-containing protein n=1 Tax=Catenaria anguillulae PL171 TaxID=765915 RepID=A0A1Y2HYX4_9FUNG|nr:Sodium/hydrogen exchanger family-domain-containing protein [Catenaria anguillulae PL171]
MLFFKNIPMILALAFAGGIFSTIVIALIMYLATAVTATPWSLLETLIFGALVSSTDPVSILAMLPKETDRSLYITIFGESALNDAVAIILYRFFCGLAAADHGRLTFGLFLLSVLQSVWVFVGSFTVGIGLAFLFAKLTKHQRLTHDAETVEVIMLLVLLTRIISVFFTGIAMAHYAKPNMTSMSVLVAKHILHIFSAMADCFIFMYLGMGLFVVCRLAWAVAFALAVGLLDNESLDETKRSLMFGTAVLVIVITVYGINLLTPFMINKFKIADSSAAQRNAQAGGGAGGSDSDSEEDEGPLPESEIPPGLIGWLYRIDQHHLLPFLTNMNSTSHGRPRGSEGDKHPEGGTYGKVKHGINLADLADDGDVVALQSGAGAIPSSLGSNKPNMSMLGVEKTKDIGAGEKNGNVRRVSKEEVGGGLRSNAAVASDMD